VILEVFMRVDRKKEQVEERKAKKKIRKRIIIISSITVAVCVGCVCGYIYRDEIQKIAKRTEEIKKIRKDIDAIKDKLVTTANEFGDTVSDVIF